MFRAIPYLLITSIPTNNVMVIRVHTEGGGEELGFPSPPPKSSFPHKEFEKNL